MEWEKLGLIFDPALLNAKGLTAALMPMPEWVDSEKKILRVYFTPRDINNRSELHYFEMDITLPGKILNVSTKALLKHGSLGAFDASGITSGNIVQFENRKILYYTGWNLTVSVPMNNSIGIAEMDGMGEFRRYGDGPILTRNLKEPYSCASPFVMFDQSKFKMWYASMDKWEDSTSGPKHFYNIKYAESDNGVDWLRKGIVCLDYDGIDDYAFGRPFVIKELNIYKMWYSYRGDFYKIGYAESKDGMSWRRKDEEVGIHISKEGWDSEMIEYPTIINSHKERYMLYNGNGYGKSGIGLARLVK